MRRMRYLIAGTGALGMFYGTRLIRAGADVVFAAPSGGDLLASGGIRVVRAEGEDEVFSGVRVIEVSREDHGERWLFEDRGWRPDAVIVTIKATGKDWLSGVKRAFGDEFPVVVTLQNGLGNEEWIRSELRPAGVGGGICFVCVNRRSTGVVEHQAHGAVSLGWFDGEGEEVCEALRRDLKDGGVEAGSGLGILREIRWRKLMWNVPFNGLSIIEDASVDRLIGSGGVLEEVRGLMGEIRRAALAEGCDIPASYEEDLLAATEVAGAYYPSTHLDWKAGRLVELDAIWREPLRRGCALGVAMPLLHRLVKALEQRVIW